ncbi:acyl-homoserine-lactone synthase [uncultured Algimonas sp.]|uniref:acyl-homoserine-lactone synthase n=1 Tax=uncultured Algimonas sp. TaxID=1547920 RepID=UPI0026323963|nr:acyl-homoserine-lactone synthase [uncultured Algimonas sp.]
MKVHIVNTTNIALYGPQLDQMHRQRKAMFVDRLGWTELDQGGDYEVDEFDNEFAHYLLLIDDVGQVLASCRVSPTNQANVSCDKLAEFFDGVPPREEKVWEVSRWIPAPGVDGLNEICSSMMMLSLFEFGLSRKLDGMISCVGRIVTRAIARAGLPLSSISPPIRFAQGVAFGIQFETSVENITRLRRSFRIFKPITIELSKALDSNLALEGMHSSIIDSVLAICDLDILSEILSDVHSRLVLNMRPTLDDIRDHMSDVMKGGQFQ